MSPHTKLSPSYKNMLNVNILLNHWTQLGISKKEFYSFSHSTFKHAHELILSLCLPQITGRSQKFHGPFWSQTGSIWYNIIKKFSSPFSHSPAPDRVYIRFKPAMEGGVFLASSLYSFVTFSTPGFSDISRTKTRKKCNWR